MICLNQNSKIILETKGFLLCECNDCKIIFSIKNRPAASEIYQKYYREDGQRFGIIVEFIVKTFRFIRALKIFAYKPEAMSVLDIGSGRGWMLYFLKEYFKYEKTAGTQIAENAFNFSKDKLGLNIYNKDLLELGLREKFDAITLWHSLEHVENPEKYVVKLFELLNKEGILYIEVPNFNSWTRKITGRHWLALDLKHHLTFFTPASLSSLLAKYNFKIRKIRTFSLEYSTFTSTQSLVNLLTGSDDYFFDWLQNKKFSFRIIIHTVLFALLFIPCFLINLLLYFSKSGEVISILAEKNE